MLTKTIDIYEAQTHFQELIALVTAGAEVVLTEKTKPLIRLVPITSASSLRESSINGESQVAHDDEYDSWTRLAQASLAAAYAEDEPEYRLSNNSPT
jgi:antitoxin (DNA-binding transcriptional repressor) of toxin-antitoxin stability system